MRKPNRTRRVAGLALFAIACAVSPSMRELVGGRSWSEPAAMSLLSFCLACIALALVIRSAIGDRSGRRGRMGDGRHADARPHALRSIEGARARMPRRDPGRD